MTLLENGGRNDGPPDLDELWRDFNRKLSGLFSGRGAQARQQRRRRFRRRRPNFQPNLKSAGVGAALIGGVVVLIWLGSGVFIVQEGQQAVVTSFGRYSHTVDAGFQWRLPYPFQAHETVNVTQLRSTEVGRNAISQATGLRDSSMLTQDENIVDIRFTVQYRLKDARAFLFENRDPETAVTLAAESAVREIVGKSKIDSVLYEQRDALASELVQLDPVAARPAEDRHPDRQRQRAERAAARAGAGRVRGHAEGGPGRRPAEEGSAGLRQLGDPEGAGHRVAPARGGRGLQGARRLAGRGRRRPLRAPARRIPEGAAGRRATASTSTPCARSTRTSPRS